MANDEHLHCFLLLQEISCILCTDVVCEGHPAYLRILVQDYLSTLKQLYPSVNLPPKAHYLVRSLSITYEKVYHSKKCINMLRLEIILNLSIYII